ncbi:MAG: MFS transporter [Actinomycetota bacterium]|nr:MFS transporter [Actinomycetota bacterium]
MTDAPEGTGEQDRSRGGARGGPSAAGPGSAVGDPQELNEGAGAGPGGPEIPPSPWTVPEFRKLLPIGFVVAIGFSLVIPVLPAFARSFGVGLALVGLVQLVFGFNRFSFGIVGGLVVDRFGERFATVTGILIVAASSYASGLAQTFWQLVVARGIGGAGSALFIGGLMNRIIKIIPPRAMGRATGIWRSSFLIGAGIGPLVGGLLRDQLGNRAPFHIYATGLLLAATIAWFAMNEKLERKEAQKRSPLQSLRAARPLFKDIRYSVALLATLVGWWTLSGPAQQIGTIFADEQLGFSGTKIGIAFTLLSAAEIFVVLVIAGPAADRYGRRAVLVPSLVITFLATLALGQVDPVPNLFFPLMVLIGAGVAAGSAAAGGLLADSIPEGGSGTAVGVNQMAGDLGYMLAPSALGAVADARGYGPAYVVAAIPAAVALVFSLRLPKETPAGATAPGPASPHALHPTPEPTEPVA